MDATKTPEPHCCYAEILLDLACCMGLAGVRAVVESCGAAVQAHEQSQRAAGVGQAQ